MKLLLVVDAPGPAEFIAPVIPLLQKSYELALVAVKDSPAKILASFTPQRCDREDDAAGIWRARQPNALIAGMSSLAQGPYAVKRFTELAHAEKKPVICFQDYWANHRWPMNRAMMPHWNAVLVPDARAERYLREDGYQGTVAVTGNPSFDKFRAVDVAAERTRLRAQLKIPDSSFVILYSGTGTPQSEGEDKATFVFLAEAIRALRKAQPRIALIARPHPRDERPRRYEEYAPDLLHLDTSAVPLTDDLLPIADAIVSMYSTNLIHACYLRIPAISVLLPDAGRKRLAQIHLDDFPPNETGASIGVYENSVPRLTEIFEKLIADHSHRGFIKKIQDAQMKTFTLDHENAAERVRDAIIRLFPV